VGKKVLFLQLTSNRPTNPVIYPLTSVPSYFCFSVLFCSEQRKYQNVNGW